jgi:hypothetical protein
MMPSTLPRCNPKKADIFKDVQTDAASLGVQDQMTSPLRVAPIFAAVAWASTRPTIISLLRASCHRVGAGAN